MYIILGMAFFVGLGIFVLWHTAKESEREEKNIIIALNRGHQAWCTAGIEKSGNCSCKTMPSYLTLSDIEKRHQKIRQLAASKSTNNPT